MVNGTERGCEGEGVLVGEDSGVVDVVGEGESDDVVVVCGAGVVGAGGGVVGVGVNATVVVGGAIEEVVAAGVPGV